MRACSVCGGPSAPGSPRCAQHGGNRRAMTREQRGYGYRHRVARRLLLPAAIGTPCPLCGAVMRPGEALDLHHRTRLVDNPLSVADQIVHAACNRAHR